MKDLAGNALATSRVWTVTTAPATALSYVSDRTASSSTNGWGAVERDRSNNDAAAGDGLPLPLNGVVYAKGLGSHAPSDVRYALNGVCTLLTVNIGVDDEVGTNGSVVFQVWTDGVQRFDSGVMNRRHRHAQRVCECGRRDPTRPDRHRRGRRRELRPRRLG